MGIIRDWRTCTNEREKYQFYLASREWAVLKEAVRSRSGGWCENCHEAPGQNVHHQTYERKYHERLDDLVHVCIPCHEFLSGKRDRNPWLDTTPRLFGERISKVYLAGKITRDAWRDQIASGWSWHERDSSPEYIECRIPDGRQLLCVGPFWVDIEGDILGGHCGFEGACGEHAQGMDDEYERGPAGSNQRDRNRWRIARESKEQIRKADLVFAWINSCDCFGTIAEIGYALGSGKVVFVAMSSTRELKDLWFVRHMADLFAYCGSPKHAWDTLWNTHSCTDPTIRTNSQG